MFCALCKPRGDWRGLTVAGLGIWVAGLAGCTVAGPQRSISLDQLESAPAEPPPATRRYVVSDPAALGRLYQPVGRRLGLIQVRSERDWRQLAAATPGLGPCPDLEGGIVVGLVSPTGRRLDGQWPLRWDSIHLCQGAGLIEAGFRGGSYLPDGTTYLETAHVDGLAAVLVVAVDGIHYLPQ